LVAALFSRFVSPGSGSTGSTGVVIITFAGQRETLQHLVLTKKKTMKLMIRAPTTAISAI